MLSPQRRGGGQPSDTTGHGPGRAWPGPRLAAAAGLAGPLLLGGTILTLTLRQQAFLHTLGWDPLRAPTVDWPSGLALSPDGPWMVAAFVGSGALLSLFAAGLHRHLARSGAPGWGPRLLGGAGLALTLLGFKADPTLLPTPRTLAGTIHDGAYVLLGLTLFPGMLLLAGELRRREPWCAVALPTLLVVALAAPAFVLKGLAFYGALTLILGWFLAIAGRLWQLTRSSGP
ncbi:MAG: DUF998 domain-containing protein [Chloroflexales bacterium]|nr:DUF998 domain-containing protein [Chloroflexales bacterium]